MEIPFLSFTGRNKMIKKETLMAFETFFDNQWYVLGDSVINFEESYAEFNSTKYCVGLSNGLDALHLSLLALGVGKGDEVIIPSNTFIASVLAISYVGAIPVFVEPRIDTYNINPELIENAITPKTKAIIPVHLYGQSCEMDEIINIAKRNNLFVIEDNAQSQGATWNGKITGSFGDVNAVSFYPGKNLGAFGDAGGVTTNSLVLADKIKILRNYGSQKKYYNKEIGYNHRMDECQAALLNVSLKYLPNWTKKRQKIAQWYLEELKGIEEIVLPKIKEGATSVFHLFVIRTLRRDKLQNYLNKEGIETLIHYPIPPHLQECYAELGFQEGAFPIAEEIADTCLSLPIYIGLERRQIECISRKIKLFFNE